MVIIHYDIMLPFLKIIYIDFKYLDIYTYGKSYGKLHKRLYEKILK